MECDNKIDCTTAVEQGNGFTRYICGRIPCEYINLEECQSKSQEVEL